MLADAVCEDGRGRTLYGVADEAVIQPDPSRSITRADGQFIARGDQCDPVGLQVTEHVVGATQKVPSIRSVPAEAGTSYR